MRILTFTTLYPNAAQPIHGVFVENRLQKLRDSGEVEMRVVAPVPWFPSASAIFGSYGTYAKVPREEDRKGVHLYHPRYLVIPKVGMNLTPYALYASSKPVVRRLIEKGYDFGLIDAHYFYPDGVAAMMLARAFGKPVTITARGTDINLIPRFPRARRLVRWAADGADGLITVCQALKDELVSLGVAPDKIRVLRNGVDLELFHPSASREDVKSSRGLASPILLSVGSLIERKRHDLVIRALTAIPQATLLIVGDGPEDKNLKTLAESEGVADRTRFLGAVPHQELASIYSAADVLVLASSREGWANVLLEAMACGTPVVATNVWGAPEVVTAPEAGVLVDEDTPAGIAEAVTRLLSAPPRREDTRAYAERFGWETTTAGQLDLFTSVLEERKRAGIGERNVLAKAIAT